LISLQKYKDNSFLRTQEDKDFILSNIDEPYSIENFINQKDVDELINMWEKIDNKEHKNTGPITSTIKNFNSHALSKIRDKIYFDEDVGNRKTYPNIEIRHAMFFCVDTPHIIHIDDSMDSFPKIYKAFNFPLRFDGGVGVPDLMFFDQLYLDGPSKFFKGDTDKTRGHHESLQFAKFPRSKCVYEYSNVINKSTKPFDSEIKKKYLDHIKDDWLDGLSFNSAHKWIPGNAIIFDSCRLHCGSDFRKLGINNKLGISIFTQHK
jgi:hypothetical protein